MAPAMAMTTKAPDRMEPRKLFRLGVTAAWATRGEARAAPAAATAAAATFSDWALRGRRGTQDRLMSGSPNARARAVQKSDRLACLAFTYLAFTWTTRRARGRTPATESSPALGEGVHGLGYIHLISAILPTAALRATRGAAVRAREEQATAAIVDSVDNECKPNAKMILGKG